MVGRRVPAIALLATVMAGCGVLRPLPMAHTCADWTHLDAPARIQTAEALIEPGRVTRVRERQLLPPGTPDAEVFAAVAGTFDKVCELERRPALTLMEIVATVYP